MRARLKRRGPELGLGRPWLIRRRFGARFGQLAVARRLPPQLPFKLWVGHGIRHLVQLGGIQ